MNKKFSFFSFLSYSQQFETRVFVKRQNYLSVKERGKWVTDFYFFFFQLFLTISVGYKVNCLTLHCIWTIKLINIHAKIKIILLYTRIAILWWTILITLLPVHSHRYAYFDAHIHARIHLHTHSYKLTCYADC